jgi:hypothetical protein
MGLDRERLVVMFSSRIAGRRSTRVIRVVVAGLAAQLLAGGQASAQRPAAITDMSSYFDGSQMMLDMSYDTSVCSAQGYTSDIWEGNSDTIDSDATRIVQGSTYPWSCTSGGELDGFASAWSGTGTTYEFFIGDQNGNHCQWYGLSV